MLLSSLDRLFFGGGQAGNSMRWNAALCKCENIARRLGLQKKIFLLSGLRVKEISEYRRYSFATHNRKDLLFVKKPENLNPLGAQRG
jgi:hypothetical protein